MKKGIVLFYLLFSLSFSFKAKAFWGNPADTIALAKILANAIQQLIRLKQIVQTGKRNLDMIKDINSGLSAALGMIQTIYPEMGQTLYQDWDTVNNAMKNLKTIYGDILISKDKKILENLDRGIAEAIILHNAIYKHSKKIDQVGEEVKQKSMGASPKGAAKLTAQSMGVMLQVQNQSLKTQAAVLKLQAQKMANENQREKEETNFFVKSSKELKKVMKEDKKRFRTLRF